MITKTRNIEEVEKRLQFTIVLGMFFPVLLEALFNMNGSDTREISSTLLKAGLLITILITNYLIFEWTKNKLSKRQLDYLSWSFFSTIACYGSVFLFLGFVANGNINSINSVVDFIYGFVLAGSMYIPVVSIVIMLLKQVVSVYKKLSK
ncbi:MAG TPA: hypothetical protein PKA42_02315 [Candidatus Paceibacterota bacterium]|nr:hypothetical protein [Candidatus Paceibacterota bacterium]HMO82978.1 hypothetical protein [Candidatus Paceibacterota bacterium]